MKASELKAKSIEELNAELLELLREQFNYRMQASTGQLAQTHLLFIKPFCFCLIFRSSSRLS